MKKSVAKYYTLDDVKQLLRRSCIKNGKIDKILKIFNIPKSDSMVLLDIDVENLTIKVFDEDNKNTYTSRIGLGLNTANLTTNLCTVITEYFGGSRRESSYYFDSDFPFEERYIEENGDVLYIVTYSDRRDVQRGNEKTARIQVVNKTNNKIIFEQEVIINNSKYDSSHTVAMDIQGDVIRDQYYWHQTSGSLYQSVNNQSIMMCPKNAIHLEKNAINFEQLSKQISKLTNDYFRLSEQDISKRIDNKNACYFYCGEVDGIPYAVLIGTTLSSYTIINFNDLHLSGYDEYLIPKTTINGLIDYLFDNLHMRVASQVANELRKEQTTSVLNGNLNATTMLTMSFEDIVNMILHDNQLLHNTVNQEYLNLVPRNLPIVEKSSELIKS